MEVPRRRARALAAAGALGVTMGVLVPAPVGARVALIPDNTTPTTTSPTMTLAPPTSVPAPTTTLAPTTTVASRSAPTTPARRRVTTTTSPPTRRASTTTAAPTTTSEPPALRSTTTQRREVEAVPLGEDGQSTTTSTVALHRAASATGLSTDSLVALVISGLLAVALALSFLTWRYWRATQPPSAGGPPAP